MPFKTGNQPLDRPAASPPRCADCCSDCAVHLPYVGAVVSKRPYGLSAVCGEHREVQGTILTGLTGPFDRLTGDAGAAWHQHGDRPEVPIPRKSRVHPGCHPSPRRAPRAYFAELSGTIRDGQLVRARIRARAFSGSQRPRQNGRPDSEAFAAPHSIVSSGPGEYSMPPFRRKSA